MATINNDGNVVAHCPDCGGSRSTFEWQRGGYGHGSLRFEWGHNTWRFYVLLKCAGCGRGGIGFVEMISGSNTYGSGQTYQLLDFYPESAERLPIPGGMSQGLKEEFEEAEDCLAHGFHRAASGLFRSALDKALRAAGYKIDDRIGLKKMIDLAAADGILTATLRKRAHEEVRVLGNDVLHDEWRQIDEADVTAAAEYTKRVLDALYDDREGVLEQLREKGRKPIEDRAGDAQPTEQPKP